MLDDSSSVIQSWLIKLRDGNPRAREELFTRTQQRLERLARKMLRCDFTRLGKLEETMDVVQDVNLRLLKGWDKVCMDADGNPVQLAGEFFQRTARLLREVLLDMARKHHGRHGQKPATTPLQEGSDDSREGVNHDPGTDTFGPEPLSMWEEFHQAVDQLPEELRQVIDLHWYQDLPHQETAELLGLGESTVRKRWVAAKLELYNRFGKSPFDL